MKCIILAGGFATRLWPLTEKVPKPLVILNGKPLLSHVTDKIPNSIEIILSVNSALSEYFQVWQIQNKNKNIRIYIEDAKNEGEKLGALFAVSKCIQENNIDEDLMILAGDNYFDFEIKDFIANYKSNPLIAVYDIGDKKEASKFGVVIGKNGVVQGFEEKPENPKSTLVSTGCYILPKDCLNNLCSFAENHRDNLGSVFEHFLKIEIPVEYYSFSGKWFDIGSFESYINAHKKISGEKVIRGENITEKNVQYSGAVYLGNNTKIKNALIEDSVILEGANIQNAEIRNSVVGKNVFIKGVDLEWKIIRDESFVSMN